MCWQTWAWLRWIASASATAVRRRAWRRGVWTSTTWGSTGHAIRDRVSIDQISSMDTPIVDLHIEDKFKKSGFTFDDDFNERDHGLQSQCTPLAANISTTAKLNCCKQTLRTRETLKNIRLHSNTSIHANRRFPEDILNN